MKKRQDIRKDIFCIIDAIFNRSREGIRVVEEIARFVLNNNGLCLELKTIRQDISKLSRAIFSEYSLVTARHSGHDSGTKTYTTGEGKRSNFEELAIANFLRAQEALRCLEEFSKPISAVFGKKFKKYRFRLYELEDTTLTELRKKQLIDKFESSELYVVLDSRFSEGRSYEYLAKQVLKAGVKIIQLRDKKLSSKKLLAKAKRLRYLTLKHNALLIINDHPDIALLSEADGVHLGQGDLSIKLAKQVLGEDRLYGKSTHSLKQASLAETEGASYISVGPIYKTNSKITAKPVGTKLIKQVKSNVKTPFVAIGGLTIENVDTALNAGSERVAVIKEVISQKNVFKSTKKLVKKIIEEKRKLKLNK